MSQTAATDAAECALTHMTKNHPISIAQVGSTRVLSPGQKKFNSLIQKIGVQRKLLTDWTDGLPLVERRHALEFVPLLDAYGDLNADLVRLLDQRADDNALSKIDKSFLQELICDLASSLMHTRHADEMKAIYNRHSPTDFDAEVKASQDELKQRVQEQFGVDLDDDAMDAASPEEMLARVQAQVEAQLAQQEARREQARSAHQQARRKPSAKQAKARTEEVSASQSIREVYRKLASALHPDRETDAAERVRKTELMQRVNQAYQKNDLLSLLQLQLEIEQIDQNALDGIAEERLRHYNKVLAGQLDELQQEVQIYEERFKEQYNVDPYERVTPATMMKAFVKQKQLLQGDTRALQRQLHGLADDMKYFKRWLKERREIAQEEAVMDDFLAGMGAGYR